MSSTKRSWICEICYIRNDINWNFCKQCGNPRNERNSLICPNCTQVVPSSFTFCPYCGNGLSLEISSLPSDPSKVSIIPLRIMKISENIFNIELLNQSVAAPSGKVKLSSVELNRIAEAIENVRDINVYTKTSIEELGGILYDTLIPRSVQKSLEDLTPGSFLRLVSQSELLGYPWEVMFDGSNFISLKFRMGRQVSIGGENRISRMKKEAGLRVLIIANPTCDLEGAEAEAYALKDLLSKSSGNIVKLLQRDETKYIDVLKEMRKGYDIIHYAGHANFNDLSPDESSLRLNDEELSAYTLTKLTEKNRPRFVFINACKSAMDTRKGPPSYDNQVYGLTSALLNNGIFCVGNIWSINDTDAVDFTREFYKAILDGRPLGDGVRIARYKLYDKNCIDWAGYVYYGDPSQRLL